MPVGIHRYETTAERLLTNTCPPDLLKQSNDMKQKSKFLSRVLRHKPQEIGITLDAQGWVEVDCLLRQAAKHGMRMSRQELDRIVAENDKKRFTLSEDGQRIRAAQGHSVSVDLGLTPMVPPEWLFHGTATRVVDVIRKEGLKPGQRQHVHLSADTQIATKVGQRHGVPHVFRVASGKMQAQGLDFCRADNGVWLTDHVPPEFLVG